MNSLPLSLYPTVLESLVEVGPRYIMDHFILTMSVFIQIGRVHLQFHLPSPILLFSIEIRYHFPELREEDQYPQKVFLFDLVNAAVIMDHFGRSSSIFIVLEDIFMAEELSF